jgi:hypothetical protein
MKIIDLNVRIEYDPIKDEIVSYSTSLNGVAEKKTTTTKKSSKKKEESDESYVIREENKIVLSSKLVEELGAEYEDRIAINYQKDENKLTFPVIGLSTAFGGKESGNKLTKTNTVAFRGKANELLAEFGTKFTVELLSPGIYRLIGDTQASKPSTPEAVIKTVDMGIEVTSDTNYKIEDLNFEL